MAGCSLAIRPKNVASVSARAFLDHMGEKRGLEIALNKGLPLSSGLGSSAASAVVAVIALNKLYGEPYSREELLPFCLEGEALVSGYHADNVAPCLLGGITLVAGIAVDAIRPLPAPKRICTSRLLRPKSLFRLRRPAP